MSNTRKDTNKKEGRKSLTEAIVSPSNNTASTSTTTTTTTITTSPTQVASPLNASGSFANSTTSANASANNSPASFRKQSALARTSELKNSKDSLPKSRFSFKINASSSLSDKSEKSEKSDRSDRSDGSTSSMSSRGTSRKPSIVGSSISSNSSGVSIPQNMKEKSYSFNELCYDLIKRPDTANHKYIYSVSNDKLSKMHEAAIKEADSLIRPKEAAHETSNFFTIIASALSIKDKEKEYEIATHEAFNMLFDTNYEVTPDYNAIVIFNGSTVPKLENNTIYLQITDEKIIQVHTLTTEKKPSMKKLSIDEGDAILNIKNLVLPVDAKNPVIIYQNQDSELFKKIRSIYTPHEVIGITKHGILDCYLTDHQAVLGKGSQGQVIMAYKFPCQSVTKVSTDKYRENMVLSSLALKISNDTLNSKDIRTIASTLQIYGQYDNDCTIKGKKGSYLFLERILGKSLKEMMYELDTSKNPDDPDLYTGKRYIKPEHKLSLMRQLLTTMMAFHVKGYVHKDIKPENTIFLAKLKSDISFLLTLIDLDDATNENKYTTNDCGTNPYKDPKTICPEYHFCAMPENLANPTTLPKEHEIQIEFTATGLKYRTRLSESPQLILWDEKKLPKNFPLELPKFEKEHESGKFYRQLDDKFRSRFLAITTPKGHTGVLHTPQSDCRSLLVMLLEFMTDENLQKLYRKDLNEITKRNDALKISEDDRKGKMQIDEEFISIAEEHYHITDADLYRYMPTIFTNKFLHEIFSEKQIDSTWLNLSPDELYQLIEPYLENYLDSDKQKLKINPSDLVNEIVFRLYIVPDLTKELIKFKTEAKCHDVVKEIDRLSSKFNELCDLHNEAYKNTQATSLKFKKANRKPPINITTLIDMNNGELLLTRSDLNGNTKKQIRMAQDGINFFHHSKSVEKIRPVNSSENSANNAKQIHDELKERKTYQRKKAVHTREASNERDRGDTNNEKHEKTQADILFLRK